MRRLGSVLLTAALTTAIALGPLGAGASAAGIDPATFVRHVDNPYFPLKPGTTFRYRGAKDGKPALDVFTVTRGTKRILGVTTTVIRDRLYLDGKLAESTVDWYAQDRRGTVWYLGEATKTLDARGRVKSREGSWQAGVDGARAGIFMPAHPKVGEVHRQEFYKGHAEDHYKVLSLSASVSVPFVSTANALRTKEWTPLEPGVIDAKYYVRGVGLVYEAAVKGGTEHLELVSRTQG